MARTQFNKEFKIQVVKQVLEEGYSSNNKHAAQKQVNF
jgi:transposase-like protein